MVGSNASLRFDLDIHDRVILISEGGEVEVLCDSSHSPLEAELKHMISTINKFKSDETWTPTPDYGAALRGVRWTERALRELPIPRPH